MRSITFLACMLCLLGRANATTYYFSSSTGDDSRSAAQASNQATPWKSIAKLNSFFSSLKPGDVVLFKRGDTFFGTIKAAASGTGSAPITFGAYGSGNKPQITGFVTLTNWVSVGGGKYESTNSSLLSSLNVVRFNGANQHMGRFPNPNADKGGYLYFESHGSNYITDNELTSATNWKGAELVVRTQRPVLDRVKITDHSSTRLTYSPALTYAPENNFGYFVQNDVRTLDQTGEWYYNAGAKKLTMYFGSTSPSSATVQASALANVLYVYGHDYLVFDNLAFTGANEDAVYLYSAENIVIRNSDVSFSNTQAIWASNTVKLLLENNTINHTHNIAVNLSGGTYAVVRGNTITNTALLGGMGQSGANQAVGIREAGTNHTIEGNTLENIGYHGIRFAGNYALIKNNLVSNFNLTRDDGAGIYTWNSPTVVPVGQKVIGNTVINGTGASAGTTSWPNAASTSGIYLDSYSCNIEVANNTVANINARGIFLHNTNNINLHDNLVYDNPIALHFGYDIPSPVRTLRNNTVKNNIFFAKKASQTLLSIRTLSEGIAVKATFDNNYYCRPLDDGYYIQNSFLNSAGTRIDQTLDLASWQKIYGKDLTSKRTVKTIVPHTLDALLGSNRFTNGTFNSNISGVNGYSAVSFTRTWVNNKLDGGTFQGTISSSTPNIYTASVPVGAVTAGKKYVIHFTAQSSRDTSMNVFLRTTSSPLRVISNDGTKTVAKISASRKNYEYAFTPTHSESNAVLFFELNGRSHSFWLDNIKVHEADVTLTNPDDSIRFVYNHASSSKTIALNGSYVDAKGTSYSNSITLAPYATAALIRTSAAAPVPPSGNKAPTVSLTSPTANASFAAPASVKLAATASDPDGSITKVEFYNGSNLIGTEKTAPYEWTWTNVAAGTYSITAKAYDNAGQVTASAPVSITVGSSGAPVVSLTSPKVNTSYTAPASVQLTATASSAGSSISKVEFYNGSKLIVTEKTAPYDWKWTKVAAGTYTITAKAYDNKGKVTTSAPATITVGGSGAPVVSMSSPAANTSFTAPASVRLAATASDPGGSITKVEFYSGSKLIVTEKTAPYEWTWGSVPAGTYTITAKAYDNSGKVTTSAPATITVSTSGAPVVSLTSPKVNTSYTAPASVQLTATASDPGGSITKVEFYNGSKLIVTEKTAPYNWTWSKVAAGTYTITAKAYDNSGKVTTSTPATITVKSSSLTSAATGSSLMMSRADVSDQQLSAASVRLYPNPAVSNLYVEFGSLKSSAKATLVIRNLAGSTVKTMQVSLAGGGVSVDVSSLLPGMYVLSITGAQVEINEKFLKGN